MKVPYPIKVKNGDIVKLAPCEKPEVFDKAPSGKLYVDGVISVFEDSKSIKERKNLSVNGSLDVTILVNNKGNMHDSPIISAKGLPIENLEEFKFGLEKEINKTTRSYALNNIKQEESAINAIKTTCKKFAKEQIGKRPFTNINLVNI